MLAILHRSPLPPFHHFPSPISGIVRTRVLQHSLPFPARQTQPMSSIRPRCPIPAPSTTSLSVTARLLLSPAIKPLSLSDLLLASAISATVIGSRRVTPFPNPDANSS